MASHTKSQSNSILVPRLSALPSRQFSLTDQLMEVQMDGQGRREKGNDWNREKAQDRGHGKELLNRKFYVGSGNQKKEFQEVRSTKNGIGLFINQTNKGYPPLTIQPSNEPESPQFPCTPISSPEDCLLSNMGTQLSFYKNLLQNAQKQISLYKQQNTQLRTENVQLAALVDSYQRHQQRVEAQEKNKQEDYLQQIQYLMDRLEEYEGLISKLEDKIVMLNYVIKKRQYQHKCDEIYEGFEQSCWVAHEKQKQLSKKITNKPYTVQSPIPYSKSHSKCPQNLTQKYLDFEIQDMDSRSNTIPNRMQKSRKIYEYERDRERQEEVLETPIRVHNKMNKKITDTTAQNQISISDEKSARDKEKQGRKQDSVDNQHSFQMSIQQKFKERYRWQNPNKEADGNKLTDLRKKAIEARRDRINYLKNQKKQTLTKQSNSNNSQYSYYCPHKKFKTESSLSKFQQNFELEYENEIQQKFVPNFARNADIHNSNKSNSHKNNNSHNYQQCSQNSHNKAQTEIKLQNNYENQWREICTKCGDCVTPRPKRETKARTKNWD